VRGNIMIINTKTKIIYYTDDELTIGDLYSIKITDILCDVIKYEYINIIEENNE
jgi:hypothetical protein